MQKLLQEKLLFLRRKEWNLSLIQDIIYCHGKGNYTELYMMDKSKIISSRTMKLYEIFYLSHSFFRAQNPISSILLILNHIIVEKEEPQ